MRIKIQGTWSINSLVFGQIDHRSWIGIRQNCSPKLVWFRRLLSFEIAGKVFRWIGLFGDFGIGFGVREWFLKNHFCLGLSCDRGLECDYVIEDMSFQTNVTALAVEEIAPVAVSDAAMLAPEEFWNNDRGCYKCNSVRGCPARKHVERALDDASMLDIEDAGTFQATFASSIWAADTIFFQDNEIGQSMLWGARERELKVAKKLKTQTVSGYSNDSNPFGDSNLNEKLDWIITKRKEGDTRAK
ncbi:WRKY DNA-binding protein [Medicago truncatula]|uniref:WRKY DNA-binding protein n=1 Tax=Medicago truncatula TaxID=3880 RepID=A0A072TI79_MEDTR|nr:WRKY DNA-binding protein [Medicago truncatula]